MRATADSLLFRSCRQQCAYDVVITYNEEICAANTNATLAAQCSTQCTSRQRVHWGTLCWLADMALLGHAILHTGALAVHQKGYSPTPAAVIPPHWGNQGGAVPAPEFLCILSC
jgi:hypothetical protein